MRAEAHAHEGHTTEGATPVVPTKAMNLIERSLHGENTEVSLAVVDNKVLVRSEGSVISSVLLEGRFPRYQDVFPKSPHAKIEVVAGPLLSVVRQGAIVTSEESRGVDFRFADGQLTLESRATDVGQSQVELPIAYDGEKVEITFDPHYVIDFLRVLDPETTVTIELIDHESAAVFRTGDGYSYVVMPLTRER
jgi:DNA polymerase-3 subunit beta